MWKVLLLHKLSTTPQKTTLKELKHEQPPAPDSASGTHVFIREHVCPSLLSLLQRP